MPTYVYQCRACSRQTELFQKITDAPLGKCPECGGEVRKLLFPPGIVFKGSGFHINDYRKPEKKDAPEPVASGSGGADAAKDTSAKAATPAKSTTD